MSDTLRCTDIIMMIHMIVQWEERRKYSEQQASIAGTGYLGS